MGWVVVVTGLVGALVRSSYKWGYFVFGILALYYVWLVVCALPPHQNTR